VRDMLLYASFQCSCEFVPDGVDVGVVFCHRLDSLVECCNVFLHAVPSSLLVEGDLPGCLGMGGRAEVKLNKDNIVVRYAGHCSDLLYSTRKVCYYEVESVVVSGCVFNNLDESIVI